MIKIIQRNFKSLPMSQENPSSRQSAPGPLARWTWGLIFLSFIAGTVLLLTDIFPPFSFVLTHAPTSATPLLLIGIASLSFQAIRRPRFLDLLKAIMVSLAFLFWGIDQLLPSGWIATTLGDVVIVLYVIDLGWLMIDALRTRTSQPKT